MAAEVIVVFKDKNAGFFAGRLAIEMRSRKATDAASHNDQVVSFAGVFRLAGRIPEGTVTKAVGNIERSGMAAAHACERRGIVAWGLRGIIVSETGGDNIPRHHGCACCHRHAVEKVPARDLAIHSQFPVP